MRKILIIFAVVALAFYRGALGGALFIPDVADLEGYYWQEDVVMVVSPGRSGSSLLADAISKYNPYGKTLKSHLLIPSPEYKGKIVLIFSNPDKAAESILHITLTGEDFAAQHFHNVKTSDLKWLADLGTTRNQTLANNLLSYDALGSYTYLKTWLFETTPCKPSESNLLAVKYESLWSSKSLDAIKHFLSLADFEVPSKRKRGYTGEALKEREAEFRAAYNVGTEEDPHYAAYEPARALWENAPAIQYLRF